MKVLWGICLYIFVQVVYILINLVIMASVIGIIYLIFYGLVGMSNKIEENKKKRVTTKKYNVVAEQ